MKKLRFVGILLILVCASTAFSQTVVLKPKKTVYTRKGKDIPKEKRTFTVTYALFNGTMSTAAKKKLENTISYWSVFETSLKEETDNDWLTEASYKVNYNGNGFLDISLMMDGSGAYPSLNTKNVVVNLKTGEQVKFADEFKAEKLGEFAKLVDKKLKAEVVRQIKEVDTYKDTDKETKDGIKEQLNGLEFKAETFNEFSISDKGITILYDAEFPHVIQALQPNGRYFFTWAEVKPFIKTNGLLVKFVK